MSFSNLNSPSAALRVCVDQSDNGRISGKVYSQRLTRPMAFSDMGSLILRLDEVLEKQNFPQAFQHSRSFREHESNVPASADPSEGIPLAEVEQASGAKCARCWMYNEHVGEDHDHPELCPRCAAVVKAEQ